MSDQTIAMKPSPGRIVLYRLAEHDAAAINSRRSDARRHLTEHRENATGVQIHVGNEVRTGDEFPLVIVRVWPNGSVNGQVLLDGNDTYWALSCNQDPNGVQAGTWNAPPRV